MLDIYAPKFRMLVLFAISLASVWVAYRPILKIAVLKDIVDKPEARKLQKSPVPILGGVAVFFGIVVGLGFFKTMVKYTTVFPIVMSMTAMLYIGITDDIITIKPWKRMILEIAAALLIIYGNRIFISDFGEIWGIGHLHPAFGIILSCVAFVGLVNAINMIDGVDGLCSSFCIMACTLFGLLFFFARDYSFAALAAVTCGAEIPFLLHNVFGKKSKMFLGDGGSMLVGTAISAMIFELLSPRFANTLRETTSAPGFELFTMDFNLVAFSLAVMSIPVFDTLRVMTGRIIHHKSPFSPDKTHLHHYFIQVGYSHISVTVIELFLNVLVIASTILVWSAGGSDTLQLFVTVFMALLVDVGSVYGLRYIISHPDKKISVKIYKKSQKSHRENKGFWLFMQRLVDGKDFNSNDNQI